jgi:hypothetical protein
MIEVTFKSGFGFALAIGLTASVSALGHATVAPASQVGCMVVHSGGKYSNSYSGGDELPSCQKQYKSIAKVGKKFLEAGVTVKNGDKTAAKWNWYPSEHPKASTVKVGDTLKATISGIDVYKVTALTTIRIDMEVTGQIGKSTVTVKYQWFTCQPNETALKLCGKRQEDSAKIVGATGATYKVSKADRGKKLWVRVQVIKPGYAKESSYATAPFVDGMTVES